MRRIARQKFMFNHSILQMWLMIIGEIIINIIFLLFITFYYYYFFNFYKFTVNFKRKKCNYYHIHFHIHLVISTQGHFCSVFRSCHLDATLSSLHSNCLQHFFPVFILLLKLIKYHLSWIGVIWAHLKIWLHNRKLSTFRSFAPHFENNLLPPQHHL